VIGSRYSINDLADSLAGTEATSLRPTGGPPEVAYRTCGDAPPRTQARSDGPGYSARSPHRFCWRPISHGDPFIDFFTRTAPVHAQPISGMAELNEVFARRRLTSAVASTLESQPRLGPPTPDDPLLPGCVGSTRWAASWPADAASYPGTGAVQTTSAIRAYDFGNRHQRRVSANDRSRTLPDQQRFRRSWM
jgi:hypothetical protein